jgi:hypothetical protein
MSSVRTLPIRVSPVRGEAIDSWLEFLAHRNHTAWADLSPAVGLDPPNSAPNGWVVQLRAGERAAISAATGVAGATLDRMTLARYADTALRIEPATRTVRRVFPWTRVGASRYCPYCLADSGGRWQLAWRLAWSFVCVEHCCLLADTCPQCRQAQRGNALAGRIVPVPGRCANRAADHGWARCHADLTAAAVAHFPDEHPVVAAQRVVYEVIDAHAASFGIYRMNPQPSARILADMRAVAGRVLGYATGKQLKQVLPPDLLVAHHELAVKPGARTARPNPKVGPPAPARAASTAVGLTVAVDILSRPDIGSAADAMRWLVSAARDRGMNVCASNIGWGRDITPMLAGVQLAALAPSLQPSDQLRYRTATFSPRHPSDGSARVDRLIGRVPSMLWSAWSLRFAIAKCHQRRLRLALSTALLLIDTRLVLHDAAQLLGGHTSAHAVSTVLQLLQKRDEWPHICTALTRLADYLIDTDVPIDYQRRRRLDYTTTMLPQQVWSRICRDTGIPAGRPTVRARIARCFLFERLSGLPAITAVFASGNDEFPNKVADFPRHLTPDLDTALQQHCHDFLAGHGINHEPLLWQPPTSLLDGLNLPGPDPEMIEIPRLHRLVRLHDRSLGRIAAQLDTTVDVVRHILETHPAPAPSHPYPNQARVYSVAYRAAKSALPRSRFVDLYQEQGIGLRDIAASIGVSTGTVTRLARDYDIPMRAQHRPPRNRVNRNWLYDQYVNKHRSLADIATDFQMSPQAMGRWAKRHHLPIRGRRGSADVDAHIAALNAPSVLQPALLGIGGWQRLQRFAAATQYPTLGAAAEGLTIHAGVLDNQLRRLEHDLGTTLLVRAERGRPMQLTTHGARVAAAIEMCESTGGPWDKHD